MDFAHVHPNALCHGMVDEVLAQPVPRSFDARVQLASPRRALFGAIVAATFLSVIAAGILGLAGLLTKEVLASQFPILIFFGVLVAITPIWQFSNYRRARRLLTYGTTVPATLSLGTPTRGHPSPPIRAAFVLNGTQRSFEFVAEPDIPCGDGIVLVLGADAGLYVPGHGIVSARVR